MENKAPLFLQLSQRSTGEVDAVIPNTAKAKQMAEQMNTQITAWCHFYWKDTNPGAKKFYRKLSERAFSQVLLHEISKCAWDRDLKVVVSPSGQAEMASIAEFEQQDWVKLLTQDGGTGASMTTRNDPNVAFNFQDNFSVGMIHGTNVRAVGRDTADATAKTDVVEVDDKDNNVSVLTTKTTSEAQNEVNVGSRVAASSNPIVGPAASSTQSGTAHEGSTDPPGAGSAGGDAGGRMANSHH